MADIEVSFSLSDNGTIKDKVKSARDLNHELDKQGKILSKLNSPRSSYKQSMGEGEGVEYGVARGAVGTGAAGRDFAKQAQGLGGLVHVYATFAANLFAVGAAFRALSDAADTTNMIKGMDQLGAATGKSLGTIAKRLVETTDGAISFRDAIEATTKGAAAGLSSVQMNQMAEVAKKASQSLGISMPDALSRLSRGISKLEPELLDELGLYTKIDKATQDYARTIGKTATTLTDFEKRQAFANAVLKEGLDKFAAIDLAANPYDKLLASLKNVGQQALEMVNVILGPLVTLLAASPSGLMAVLTGISVLLLKQAIPALGQYRESLARTAESSRLQFTKIYKDQQASIGEMAGSAAVSAEAAYRSSSRVLNKTKELARSAAQFEDTAKMKWSELAAKDPFELTPQELKSLDNRVKTLARSNKDQADLLRAHIKEIKTLRAEATKAGDIAQERIERKASGPLSTVGANEIIYRREMTNAVAASIKSTVAETQALYGARAAFAQLSDELNKAKAGMQKVQVGTDEAGNAIMETAPKMGKVKAGLTGLSAAFGIVTTKIGTTLNALSPWLVGLGLAAEALSLFDSWMSKTAREQEAFSKALAGISDSVDNATRTIDILRKKGAVESATISGVFALSNAMSELTTSVELALYANQQLKSVMEGSWWDTAKNNVLKLFGADIDTKLAENLTKSLESSLQIFAQSGKYEKASAAFKKALGLETLDTTSVTKAFKNSTEAQKAFEQAQKELNGELAASNGRLQSFKTATENSTKAYQEFIQSTANNNPLFKLGAALEDVANSMQGVLKGGLEDVNAAFDDLVKHPEKFTLFGQKFVEQFVEIRGEFAKTYEAQQRYIANVAKLDQQAEQVRARLIEAQARKDAGKAGSRTNVFISNAQQELENINRQKQSLNAPDTQVIVRTTELFREGAIEAFTRGADLINKALGQASERAAITIAQAKLGGLTGERQAQEATRLKQQELQLQLSAINTNIDLIRSQEELKATIDLSNAIAMASDKEGKTGEQANMAQAELVAAATFKKMLSEGGRGKLEFKTTGNELADALLKLKLVGTNRQIAQQEASAIKVRGEQAAETIAGRRAIREGQLKDLEKIVSINSDIIQQEVAKYNIIQSINGAATVETAQRAIILENDILETKQMLERQAVQVAIRNATEAGNAKEIAFQKDYLAKVIERQAGERDNKGIQDRNKLIEIQLDTETKLKQLKFEQNDLVLKGTGEEIARNQDILGIKNSLYLISSQEYEQERNRLTVQAALNSFAREELKLQKDKAAAISEVQSRIDKAASDPSALNRLNLEKEGIEKRFKLEEEGLAKAKQGKLEAIALDQSMSDKMKGYSNIVENAFVSMGDAIAEFAKTGKLNFKGLVDSMIADLIRFELQQQMKSLYGGLGGLGGLTGLIGGWLNPTGAANAPGGSKFGMDLGFDTVNAKGAVYNAGLQMFAKGGAFTNSIVNDPTVFKFAQGTGIMGEAGPEAIVPLKRDSNGNLGVRTNQQQAPQTSVVVNNYGSEKATTRETTDSNGNRKIEVIIGDMVAQEVGRTGSNTQQALGSTFGTRPALARR